MLDRRLEVKTLAHADVLTVTSEPWAERLRALHHQKPVYTITHGFDPKEVSNLPDKLTNKFTITYTGIIYPGKQEPLKLFQALQALLSSGDLKRDDIEVRFYGTNETWLNSNIDLYGLTGIVRQYGKVPTEIALQKQEESQLLLLLDWDDPAEKGVYTGKIFEYLGSRRPILATGGLRGNVVDVLLDETKAGVHAPNVADIKNAIQGFYREYKFQGEVAYHGKESEIKKYGKPEMARKFAEILDSLIL